MRISANRQTAPGTVKDDTIFQRLQKFYSDTTLVRLVSDVEAKFPNLDEVEKGLNKPTLSHR